MSASNYAVCPKCNIKHEEDIKKAQTNVDNFYGKVSPQEYLELIQIKNQLVNQDEQTHLREDYEFYTHDGILEIIYACTCDICHQSYSFNKTINLTEVME